MKIRNVVTTADLVQDVDITKFVEFPSGEYMILHVMAGDVDI